MTIKPVLLALLAAATLAACETTKGLGRDVSTAGAVMEREAREAQYGY